MTEINQYGPGNPHLLSQMRTELVWEGKYDEYGRRREVDVAGSAMPLQKIETVDEPANRLGQQAGLFDAARAHSDEFRNMLIWGDNKLVMASLLRDFKGNDRPDLHRPALRRGGRFHDERPDRRRGGNRRQGPIHAGDGRLPRHMGQAMTE